MKRSKETIASETMRLEKQLRWKSVHGSRTQKTRRKNGEKMKMYLEIAMDGNGFPIVHGPVHLRDRESANRKANRGAGVK